jgi:hypothetical protein
MAATNAALALFSQKAEIQINDRFADYDVRLFFRKKTLKCT